MLVVTSELKVLHRVMKQILLEILVVLLEGGRHIPFVSFHARCVDPVPQLVLTVTS